MIRMARAGRGTVTLLAFVLASSALAAPVASGATVERYLPAAAAAEGPGGARWTTELMLFNPDETRPVRVALSFLAADRDNRTAEEVVVEVPARRGLTLVSLVDKLLGGAGGGAVRLRGDGPFLASSRTFTPAGDTPGTYGVAVPAVSREDALVRGIVLVRNEPGFRYRSNAGFVNPTDHEARVAYRVREAATGRLLVEGAIDLLPEGFAQVNDLLSPLGAMRYRLADLVLELAATASPDVCGCPAAGCCLLPSPVFSFVTTIDNETGDPTFQLGQPDPAALP